jgi:hypothetical protein
MKKIGFLTLLMMSLVLFALAFPVGAAAPAPPHPHITEALESMRAAKHHLETASHDFHGHRVKAIEHLDQAIHEAEECEREP